MKKHQKKLTRYQVVKVFISLLALFFMIYVSMLSDSIKNKIIMVILSCLILSLFYFFLWLPEQRLRWNSKAYKKKEREKWAKKVPNRFLNKVILKDNWMDNVYNEICLTYLAKKEKDHTIPMLEKVLFLMHERSLSTLDRPFIRRPIYIDNKDVRIAFLSDRLRVKELSRVSLSSTYFISQAHPPDYWQYMKVYEIMLKDYMGKSEVELDEMVTDRLSKALPKGVQLKHYQNWFYRFNAREEYYDEHKKVSFLEIIFSFFKMIYTVLAVVAVILLPLVLLDMGLHFVKNGDSERGFVIFLVLTCTIPKFLHWYHAYRKPTPFEEKYAKHHEDH